MKKLLPTLLIALFFFCHLDAQSTKSKRDIKSMKPIPMVDKSITTLLENQTVNTTNGIMAPLAGTRDGIGLLGTTIMDVQTYGSSPTRLINYGDGQLSGIWMIGFDSGGGWSDRGTGYNYLNNGVWGPEPVFRIEGDVRTGFPAFAGTSSGKEVVITHKTPPPYEFRSYIKTVDETDWTETSLPSNTPAGMLWPRVSGDTENGEYLHLIGITTATAFGGAVYEGMDPHLLYYRSPDGGDTWDQVDVIIQDVDSSFYNAIAAESYAIDSKDNYVAIGIFNSWGDLSVFKSDDYGDTWTKHIVNDFPLDKYQAGDGYTLTDIGGYNGGPSGTSTDSLAIFTNDESGAVIIDNNGQVHTFFGEMYVVDAGGLSFYPDWSGLRYWNESFGPDSTRLIADLVDHDDSGMIEIGEGEFGSFFNSLTSFPSVGIDEDNNLYLAYAAVTEEYIESMQVQHYRHIYMVKTEDGGETWTEPFDMMNDDFYDPGFVPFFEGVFPSVARKVDDRIHFLFQEDLSPGLVAWGDEDAAAASNMVYFSANKNDFSNFSVSNKEIIEANHFGLKVTPNPASDQFMVNYELRAAGAVQITLHNTMGQVIQTLDFEDQSAGIHQVPMALSNNTSAVYFVQIQSGNNSSVIKLVVE